LRFLFKYFEKFSIFFAKISFLKQNIDNFAFLYYYIITVSKDFLFAKALLARVRKTKGFPFSRGTDRVLYINKEEFLCQQYWRLSALRKITAPNAR
jgi:hypothetical protein